MTERSRRAWLKRMAALAAAGLPQLRALPARAADSAPAVRFGFSLYGMKTLKIVEALKACAEIGYDGVELTLLPGWPTEPKQLSADARRDLGKRLADDGLAVLGLMENLTEPAEDAVHRSNLDRLKAATELGQALSPKAAPVVETVLGGKPAQWEQVKDRLAKRLHAWAEVGEAAKTVIAVKPHVANALHTPEGARWLLKQIKSPWLKLAFDYSHFALRRLPLADTIRELIPESAFVHVKDSRGNADNFDFLLPGEGDIDYFEYFKQVQAAGYRGPMVVEVSAQISNRAGYDPVPAARRSYEKLAPAMQKAGVRRG